MAVGNLSDWVLIVSEGRMIAKSQGLTAEEREVLILSSLLLNNEEIAERLGISVIKVKNAIHRICLKLGVGSRQHMSHYALQRGYIKLDEVFPPEDVINAVCLLAPNVLGKIAKLICQRVEPGIPVLIDKGILPTPMQRKPEAILTRAEIEVLILIGRGFTNREISEKLSLSIGSVKNVVNKIMSKLGARSRGHAFVLAIKRGDLLIDEVLPLDEILYFFGQLDPESQDNMAHLLRKQFEHYLFETAV